MDGKHYAAGEAAGFKGFDDIGGGVIAAIQEIGIGNGIGRHGFVAHAHLIPVPPAAGVGEVEGVVEIDIKIGLGGDAECAVVVFFPDRTAVPFAQRTAVHADGGNGNEFTELLQVFAKRFVGFDDIPAGQGEVFIVVADFVPELRYLPDDGFVVAFGNDAEIVAAADAGFIFSSRAVFEIG